MNHGNAPLATAPVVWWGTMPTAVLLTCHGSVEDLADLPAFITNIRHGQPTPPAMLDEVVRRYTRIGGSPLMRETAEQARALEARLDGVRVAFAGRLWKPFPIDVLRGLREDGIDRVISLPLAPQSVHIYNTAVRAAAAEIGDLQIVEAPSWGLEPALLDACVETVDEGIAGLPEDARRGAVVVLSAHALPRRVIEAGDPYEKDFRAMAAEVTTRLASRDIKTRVAFQSQGMGGGAWLGPDLATTFAAIAATGVTSVVIAPIGFVADHVETLYDLDLEAPFAAKRAGIVNLSRAPAFNARPRFIDALEAVARRALAIS